MDKNDPWPQIETFLTVDIFLLLSQVPDHFCGFVWNEKKICFARTSRKQNFVTLVQMFHDSGDQTGFGANDPSVRNFDDLIATTFSSHLKEKECSPWGYDNLK